MTRATHRMLLIPASVGLCAILTTAAYAGDDPALPTLSFEDRVAGFEAVEDVYWSHRIWPKTNPTPKPRRDEVITHEQVAAKVERTLLLEAVLEHVWGDRLTPERVQLELNRIARNTRHPELLHDVIAALDDNAFRIAECFVRPRLVERLVNQRYAWDREIHEGLRQRVETELSAIRTIADLQGSTAVLTDSVWIRADGPVSGEPPSASEVRLTSDEWESEVRGLAGRFRVDNPGGQDAPVKSDPGELLARQAGRGISPYFETTAGFSVVEVLEAGSDRVRVVSATWVKVGFSSWLGEIEHDLRPASPEGGSYTLPKLAAADPCTDDTWIPTVGSGSPSPRKLHTMVWTGSEVIVWGGFDNTALATGGRYDPTTDTWVPTSTTGAPQGRYGAAGVWTGSEVVVWGGYSGGFPNTGGRYNPTTDTWTPTSTVNAPSGRTYVDGVWTGTEMIVWGGYSYTNTGGRYDPATDTWTTMSTTGAPSARGYHVAVWTGTEYLAWGGSDGSALDTGGRYDPATDTWTAMTTTGTPPASERLSAVWTGTEMIVWGGDPYGSPLDTGGRYDPAADSWTATTTVDAPLARGDHTAVWTGTEMVVWGGTNLFDETNTGSRYDPSTDTWTATTTSGAPIRRTDHKAVWTGTEMIVWGGHTGSYTNTGGRYDPSTDTWVSMSPDNLSARYVHTAVWTGAEMIVWGGQDNSPYTNTGSRYDPATDSWTATTTSDAPAGRGRHGAVWTGTEMIVWGGWDGPSTYFDTGGRYDPATDSWTATAASGAPTGRYDHAAVWSGTELIIWSGSTSSSGAVNSGGRYDPVTDSWTATALAGSPSQRTDPVAVWTGTEMIVWAGYSTTDTGGRYDPATDTWTTTSTTGAPEARRYSTGIWTGTELIIWGGYTGFANLDSGGRYDPTTDTWIATSTVSVPAARRLPGSVWTGTEMIVWGGNDDNGKVNTGGRYDPATDSWTTTTTNGAPSPRYGQTSVWTGSGGEMIVWGGNGASMYTDTGGRYCASGVLEMDYGDAPDPSYPTLLASNGARHFFDGVLYLGSTVDEEFDGQPTAGADGDDLDGTDDEDGVVFTSALRLGLDASVSVEASTAGLLNAWIDFNSDGDWDDPGEQIFTNEALTTGTNNLQVAIPIDATLGATFARFRFDSAGGLTPTGAAADGEVEDHVATIEPSADLSVSTGDSPDPVIEGGRLSYFILVRNIGGLDATGVVLTDTLDANVSYVSASLPACNETGGVVTCDLATLTAGASIMVSIEVDVTSPFTGTLSNTAVVTLNEADPITANNTDIETTTVVALGPHIFSDGFETGDTTRWSNTVP